MSLFEIWNLKCCSLKSEGRGRWKILNGIGYLDGWRKNKIVGWTALSHYPYLQIKIKDLWLLLSIASRDRLLLIETPSVTSPFKSQIPLRFHAAIMPSCTHKVTNYETNLFLFLFLFLSSILRDTLWSKPSILCASYMTDHIFYIYFRLGCLLPIRSTI